MKKQLGDFVHLRDPALARRWQGRKPPISEIYQSYMAGQLDIAEESFGDFFENRHDFCAFRLTGDHFKWALTNFLPEVTIHSLGQDKRIVSEHYDRGNDFFGWFLGNAMVYTSADYADESMGLEEAQYRKIDRCCDKLQLTRGESLLDIGCGWAK